MKINAKIIILSLVICALIAIIPLLTVDSEFGGADGEAGDVITEILDVEEYEPWANPVMEPPGGETESLLFCLQAALGAGVFGFGLGVLIERRRKTSSEK